MRREKSYPGVVDLFSGAGGFARGFKEAGFRILFGIDNDRSAIKSFKVNFPESIALNEDIKEISGRDIVKLINEQPGVVIGSPPCEPFTKANPNRERRPLDRLYKDPMGQLTLHFIRIVSELRPEIFVMENVPAIMEREIKENLEYLFEKAGYDKIYFNILRAEDYGTPSKRTRVFISNIRIEPPKISKRVSVWEAIGDLEDRSSGEFPNHEIVKLSVKKIKKISRVRRGEALYHYRGSDDHLYPNMIRLDPKDLAPTVMGSSRFIHPFEDRLLTVREQARLMGFPDYHVFLGGREEQYNQVGEAVPPPLAKAIGLYIINFFT
ncbi:MAG: DNA cytosine methyltransferase [Sulfolobales archaeon]